MLSHYINQVQVPIVWILIGAPGVGKTSFRNKLVSTYATMNRDPLKVCSTDDMILAEKDPFETFQQAFMRLITQRTFDMRQHFIHYTNAYCDVIVDRTNVTVSTRQWYFDTMKNHNLFDRYHKVGVCWLIEEDECMIRNRARTDKYVPQNISQKFYLMFEFPFKEEGFDEIMYMI